MAYFTKGEFLEKYDDFGNYPINNFKIDSASEMILSQVGLKFRDTTWDEVSVPLPIKNASMEQLRFMLEHDIPFIDFDKRIKAGNMDANLNSDYSSLALRILSNNGYMYRGNPLGYNMGINIPFG